MASQPDANYRQWAGNHSVDWEDTAMSQTSRPMYSVTVPWGLKSFRDAMSLRRWASKNTGLGTITIWGFSPSTDGYHLLQVVTL